MSEDTKPRTAGGGGDPPEGGSPIRDLGYSRYDGPRLPLRNRYRVLAGRTFSLAWQSGLVKTIVILGMFPMIVCAVVMYGKIKGAQTLVAQGIPEQNLPALVRNAEHWVYYCVYWCQIWFAFALSLVVASSAIADDLRTGAFHFYFSRPITRLQYVTGKLLAVASLIILVCVTPGMLLTLERIAMASSVSEGLGHLKLLGATAVFSVVYVAVMVLPAIAVSALTRNSGYAMGGWATAFFLPWVLGEGTAAATDQPLLTLVSIPTNLRLLGQQLFGVEPSYDLPWFAPSAVLLGVVALAVVVIWRRLGRAEVLVG